MNEFEDQLEREFRRVPAPPGFAESVMGRVEARSSEELGGRGLRLIPFRDRSIGRWPVPALAAAVLLTAFAGSYEVHLDHIREVKRQREAALTEERFALAMRVTSHSLENVSRTVSQAGTKAGAKDRESDQQF